MTNIVEIEEHERVSLLPVSLNIQNETSTSETEIKEEEMVVKQMSRKKTTLFIDKCSRPMTNIVENEEHERVSLTPASLNIENQTSGKFF